MDVAAHGGMRHTSFVIGILFSPALALTLTATLPTTEALAKAALTPRERALVDEWQAQHNAHEKPTENGDDNPLA